MIKTHPNLGPPTTLAKPNTCAQSRRPSQPPCSCRTPRAHSNHLRNSAPLSPHLPTHEPSHRRRRHSRRRHRPEERHILRLQWLHHKSRCIRVGRRLTPVQAFSLGHQYRGHPNVVPQVKQQIDVHQLSRRTKDMSWHQIRHDGCQTVHFKALDVFGVAAGSDLAEEDDSSKQHPFLPIMRGMR